MFWLKDTSGSKSATLTFAVAAFVISATKFLLSGVVLQVAGKNLNFGIVDAASIAALLTPTLGAYVARRHTDTRYGDKDQDPDPKSTES
jgi:hypothetical protein